MAAPGVMAEQEVCRARTVDTVVLERTLEMPLQRLNRSRLSPPQAPTPTRSEAPEAVAALGGLPSVVERRERQGRQELAETQMLPPTR